MEALVALALFITINTYTTSLHTKRRNQKERKKKFSILSKLKVLNKNLVNGPNCSHKFATFLEYHMALILPIKFKNSIKGETRLEGKKNAYFANSLNR